MFVRTGTVMDAQAVLEIRTLAWQAAYQGLMPADFLASLDPQFGLDRLVSGLSASPSPFCLKVAESNGVILGYVMLGAPRYSAPAGTLELWALNVHPTHWRRGIGQLLVQGAILDAREQRVERLEVWCLVGNHAAAGLYLANGFAVTGESRITSGLTGHLLHEVCYEMRSTAWCGCAK